MPGAHDGGCIILANGTFSGGWACRAGNVAAFAAHYENRDVLFVRRQGSEPGRAHDRSEHLVVCLNQLQQESSDPIENAEHRFFTETLPERGSHNLTPNCAYRNRPRMSA